MKNFIICLSLLFSSLMFAQENLIGKVIYNNNPVKGVIVQLRNYNTETISNEEGIFEFKNISYNHYKISIHKKGFINKEIDVDFNENNKNFIIEVEKDYFQIDEVVITATRNLILKKDAPIVCTVLDDKIFNATQSVNLLEGLSFQPALRVENNCQNCGFSGLRMNGLESAYSQVLIDGRPIFTSLQGVYGLEQIPTNMIERIEVVRSGGSALYGSSAIAGTVNVITKEPENNSYYLNSNLAFVNGKASDQTYMIGANLKSENRKSGISINGFVRNRNHWDANKDGFSELGEMKNNTLNVKAYLKPSEFSKITFNAFSIYEKRRGGNGFDLPFHLSDITEATVHNIINGNLTYEQFIKNKNHKISAYITYQNLKRDSYYGSNQDANAYGTATNLAMIGGVQYSGNLGDFLGGSNTLVTGFEYNSDHLEDSAPSYNRFINQKANQFGYYIQNLLEIKKYANLLVGARLDKHNLLEEIIVSPRANILFKISPDFQWRIGYARGFRAPQVFDEDLHITQVNGEGQVILLSPNLKPEFSNSYTTSLDYNIYKENFAVGISVDYFYTKLNDVFILEEIGSNNAGEKILERRNGDGALVRGISINPKFNLKNIFEIQLGFTFQKSEYDEAVQWSESISNNNKRIFRTPNQYGYYVLTLNATQNINLNFSGTYTGSMIAQHFAGYIPEDKLENTPSFFENNFKADYLFKLMNDYDFTLSMGIQNYTNAFQKDFDQGINRDAGYVYGPGRPRTYFMGIKLNF